MGVILKNGVYYSGPPGKGIVSIQQNADYTLTIYFSDGTFYVTEPATGAGIDSIEFNDDSTLTIILTNGEEITSPVLNYLPPVTDSDIGKTLTVNENAMWDTEDISFECWTKYSSEGGQDPDPSSEQRVVIADRLPLVTEEDEGKFLRVSSEGKWEAITIAVGDTTQF